MYHSNPRHGLDIQRKKNAGFRADFSGERKKRKGSQSNKASQKKEKFTHQKKGEGKLITHDGSSGRLMSHNFPRGSKERSENGNVWISRSSKGPQGGGREQARMVETPRWISKEATTKGKGKAWILQLGEGERVRSLGPYAKKYLPSPP